jgi:hypothetical protein
MYAITVARNHLGEHIKPFINQMTQDTTLFKRMMALLTQTNLQGRRHAICWEVSQQRTESSRDLTNSEIMQVIEKLEKGFKELDRADVMRKKIISMAHEMGWILSPALSKGEGAKRKIDMPRIDAWCIKYTGKKLNGHNAKELANVVSQFTIMYQKFIKAL